MPWARRTRVWESISLLLEEDHWGLRRGWACVDLDGWDPWVWSALWYRLGGTRGQALCEYGNAGGLGPNRDC